MSEQHPTSHHPRLTTGPGRLIVLSGPSGVGKDTVLSAIFAKTKDLHYSVSFTTRDPRPGEIDGVSYSFVTRERFCQLIDEGEFLEWAEVHGNLYGTSIRRVRDSIAGGDDVVLKIDVQGAARVRRRVQGAMTIFLLPPSEEELDRRLKTRSTEEGATLERRMEDAKGELAEASDYDYRVVNDDVEQAADEILQIVRTARAAPARLAHH